MGYGLTATLFSFGGWRSRSGLSVGTARLSVIVTNLRFILQPSARRFRSLLFSCAHAPNPGRSPTGGLPARALIGSNSKGGDCESDWTCQIKGLARNGPPEAPIIGFISISVDLVVVLRRDTLSPHPGKHASVRPLNATQFHYGIFDRHGRNLQDDSDKMARVSFDARSVARLEPLYAQSLLRHTGAISHACRRIAANVSFDGQCD